MFGIVGGGKEAFELLGAQDSWQVFLVRPQWQIEFDRCPAQRLDIEKSDGSRDHVARTPRQLTLSEQMVKIGSNVLRRELIGRALVVGGKLRDGLDILLLGAWSVAMELHLLDHSGT
jgi:hypothetical protein